MSDENVAAFVSQDVEGMFHICARGVNTGIDRGVLEGLATGWVGRGGSAGWIGRGRRALIMDGLGREGGRARWGFCRGSAEVGVGREEGVNGMYGRRPVPCARVNPPVRSRLVRRVHSCDI